MCQKVKKGLREGSGRVDECYQRDLMADVVYLLCCTKDEEHSIYYYYFGAYKAFRRNKVEKHKNKAQTFSTANTEIEQKILEAFETWNKDKDELIKYKLVHSWLTEKPQCIYVMYYENTIAASQVTWHPFTGVTKHSVKSLLGCNCGTPPHDSYPALVTKFNFCMQKCNKVVSYEVVNSVISSFELCSSEFINETIGENYLEPVFQAIKKFKRNMDVAIFNARKEMVASTIVLPLFSQN